MDKKIKVSPYISSGDAEFFKGIGGKPGTGATFALEAFRVSYPSALRDLSGYFSASELELLISLWEGEEISGKSAGEQIVQMLDEVSEHEAGQYRVHLPDLKEAVNKLSIFQRVTFSAWCRGYYRQRKSISEYIQLLIGAD